MKALTIGSLALVTGSEIAAAVMAYSKALWQARLVDLVTVPFLTDSGRREDAEFVIGWQSAVISVSVLFDGEELTDPALVADLRERARPPEAARIQPVEARDLQSFEFDEL